ncbi:Hypothetical predicted protein [Podarcis lilfordi]|uniref:Uncharacterized protein n=1 Tax=Podarcis lilfordi TaxID=74358 RepID=A0AA35L430_9SAUR|nr:Hypothetical predicted protein [Podarcis lilfordi]
MVDRIDTLHNVQLSLAIFSTPLLPTAILYSQKSAAPSGVNIVEWIHLPHTPPHSYLIQHGMVLCHSSPGDAATRQWTWMDGLPGYQRAVCDPGELLPRK